MAHDAKCENCGENTWSIVRSKESGRTYAICTECGKEYAVNVLLSMLPTVVKENLSC